MFTSVAVLEITFEGRQILMLIEKKKASIACLKLFYFLKKTAEIKSLFQQLALIIFSDVCKRAEKKTTFLIKLQIKKS